MAEFPLVKRAGGGKQCCYPIPTANRAKTRRKRPPGFSVDQCFQLASHHVDNVPYCLQHARVVAFDKLFQVTKERIEE